jgi:hypothetical protein
MGAVASFVEDVVEGVGDFVGDVVETVGDVVEDVVDVVVDVVETVGDVVQAVIEDPIPVLVSVAGQMVGIPAPVTMAALTAARGGDLEDIVLSAGTAYFAPSVASSLSETFAPALFEAIGNETVANVVAESTSKALVSGTLAEVKGGDFEDGFAGAFTGSLVNSSLGEFTDEFVKDDILAMAEENGIDIKTANNFILGANKAIGAGVSAEVGGGDFATAFTNSVANQSINAGTNYATNSIGDQFKSIGEDWDLAKEEDKEGFETTITADMTGAGIPDDIVDQVQVSDMGYDSGDSTTSLANNVSSDIDVADLYSAPEAEDAQTIAADMGMGEEPESSVTVYGVPADYEGGDLPEETFASVESPEEDFADLGILDQYAAKSAPEGEPVMGGLTAVTPEGTQVGDEDIAFYAGKPTAVTEDSVIDTVAEDTSKKPEDILAGMTNIGVTPMGEEKPVDIAGAQEKPTTGGLASLVDTSKVTPAAIGAGVLNQVVRPAIRQGLTKAVMGTPTRRPVAKKPTQLAAPKQLSGAQLQAARTAAGQRKAAPATKAAPTTQVARVAPPKKADVSKLTPITNISGLTSMLMKNKGQG